MLETIALVGRCRGIIVSGFLNWCNMDFATIHMVVFVFSHKTGVCFF